MLFTIVAVGSVIARATGSGYRPWRPIRVGNAVGAGVYSDQPLTASQPVSPCAPPKPCQGVQSAAPSERVPGAEAPVIRDQIHREPPVTRAPEASGFTAQYRTVSTRSESFRGSVVVSNGGSVAASWHVDLVFPSGVQLTWTNGGAYTQAGQTATITWPLPVEPQSTLTLEFEASKTSQNLVDFVPSTCVVNGSRCD
jgi:hypothetical protein